MEKLGCCTTKQWFWLFVTVRS